MSAFYDGYDGVPIDPDDVTPEYLDEYARGETQWMIENGAYIPA